MQEVDRIKERKGGCKSDWFSSVVLREALRHPTSPDIWPAHLYFLLLPLEIIQMSGWDMLVSDDCGLTKKNPDILIHLVAF